MTLMASPAAPDPALTIGEAARRSGFSVKSLRFYERRGLLPPSRRGPSGYRLYTEADLRRLEFIRQAKALGLTLAAIQSLVGPAHAAGRAGPRARLATMLDERIAQTETQIDTLTRLREELRRRRRLLARRPARPRGQAFCTCLEDSETTRPRASSRRPDARAR